MSKTSKSYTGPRTITATFKPEETKRKGRWDKASDAWVEDGELYVSRRAHWQGAVDGREFYEWTGATEAEALEVAGRAAARMDADEAIYPAAKAVAADYNGPAAAEGQTAEDFRVGQTVAVYSRGGMRVGLVEKVGRTNVTVVYVTASTGNLWRKADKFANVVILEPAATPAEEAPEAEAAEDFGPNHPNLHLSHEEYAEVIRAEAAAANAAEAGCEPTGRHLSDGRDELSCGYPANPAGYCCEHGTYVGPQPQAGSRRCPYGLCDESGRPRATTPRCIYCQEDAAVAATVREALEPGWTYTPDADGPVVEPATLERYEAEVAAEALEAARTKGPDELKRDRAAARHAGDLHAELVASKALELKPRPAAMVSYLLGLEALAGPLGGRDRLELEAKLRETERAIVDAAARHYGWDHSRVGGYVDHEGRNGARVGYVFVGSNYAGRILRSREELLLDAGPEPASIPLAELLGR